MLADGQNQCIQRQLEVGVGNLVWNLAARSITIALEDRASAYQRTQLPVFDHQALRFAQLEHVDVLLDEMRYVLTIRWHLIDGATVDQADLTVGVTPGGSCAIHGRVPGANNAHALADVERVVLPRVPQELQGIHHPVAVLALKAQFLAELGADHDHYLAKTIAAQLREANVAPRLHVVVNLYTEFFQWPEVLVEYGLGKPVFGNCSADHPAGVGVLLEYLHLTSCMSQLRRCRHPAGSSPDDRDLDAQRCRLLADRGSLLALHNESLDVPNRQRLIQVGADTSLLA